MSYYRSDWPEMGYDRPLGEKAPLLSDPHAQGSGSWTRQRDHLGGQLRWAGRQNELESNLYGLRVWYLVLEANDPKGAFLSTALGNPVFDQLAEEELETFLSRRPSGETYVAAKVVPGEPAYKALLRFRFEEVERRRLYTCRVGELRHKETILCRDEIEYTSLSGLPRSRISSCREQILGLCRRSFLESGHSRHFTDPFLLERCSGVDYILALMDLNFRNVEPKHFLISFDTGVSRVCGFSAVGRKPGLEGDTYTQLLSAVGGEYRGQGIYRGLTGLLSEILDHDVRLLNVTHAANEKMQKAYKNSGRHHSADTVILRRVFSGTQP
jgi:hypothetical protein